MVIRKWKGLTHEPSRVALVRSYFPVHCDQALHDNGSDLPVREGILEAIAEDDGQRQALALLVGTRRRLGGLQESSSVRHLQPARTPKPSREIPSWPHPSLNSAVSFSNPIQPFCRPQSLHYKCYVAHLHLELTLVVGSILSSHNS